MLTVTALEVIEVAHVSLANLNCNWERMVNLKQLRAQGNVCIFKKFYQTHFSFISEL